MPEKISQMKGLKGIAAKAGYALTIPATGTFWALRRGVGELALRSTEGEIQQSKEIRNNYKGALPTRMLAGIRDKLRIGKTSEAAAIFTQAIEEGKHDKLIGLTDNEKIKMGQAALRTSPELFKPIRNAYVHLAEDMGKGFHDDVKKAAGLIVTDDDKKLTEEMNVKMKIMMNIDPEFIPKMSEEALKDPDVHAFFHTRFAKVAQVANLLEKGPSDVRREYIESVKEKGIQYYDKNAPSLANYFRSNPGIRALGIPVEELEKEKESLVVSGREEEFKKAREKYKPGSFG